MQAGDGKLRSGPDGVPRDEATPCRSAGTSRRGGLPLDGVENGVHGRERRPVAPHPLSLHPLLLLGGLLTLPLSSVTLDLAERADLIALVEVFEDVEWVVVVVPRLLRREPEPASRRESNRLIAGFDYPQNGVFRGLQFGLTMRMEAAGIEPASAAAPAERLQA